MWLVAHRHTQMARELFTRQAAVSSAAESALGHSPKETFNVEVVGELVAEFQKMEERHSWLEQPTTGIYDMLLGPPPYQS
jgi:hypothetical protein